MEYGACSHRRLSIMEALDLLDNLVDESDPDVDFPNSYHAYQTAEGIRTAHPDKGGNGGSPGAPCCSLGCLPDAAPALALQTGSTSWGCCMTWGKSSPSPGSRR